MSKRDRKDRAATTAEVDLWRQAVADAAPLQNRRLPLQSKPHPIPRRRAAEPNVPPLAPPPDDRRPPRGVRGGTTRPGGDAQAIDRATLARLKKGRLPIDDRIDLHGLRAAAAEQRLRAFLRRSQAAGQKAVLVITGRGQDRDGVGRGVLRRAAPDWLRSMPDLVSGFHEADRRHGGAGALYVRIRRKDKAKGR